MLNLILPGFKPIPADGLPNGRIYHLLLAPDCYSPYHNTHLFGEYHHWKRYVIGYSEYDYRKAGLQMCEDYESVYPEHDYFKEQRRCYVLRKEIVNVLLPTENLRVSYDTLTLIESLLRSK
jgi:hypothetical protein